MSVPLPWRPIGLGAVPWHPTVSGAVLWHPTVFGAVQDPTSCLSSVAETSGLGLLGEAFSLFSTHDPLGRYLLIVGNHLSLRYRRVLPAEVQDPTSCLSSVAETAGLG